MKKIKQLFLLLFVSLLLGVPTQGFAENMQLQSGFTFDYVKGNHGFSASQLTFPLQFIGNKDNLSYRFTTGFTRTAVSEDSVDTSMSGLLDTKMGATYRLPNRLPFELLLGLDVNLPTGKTRLSNAQTALILDSDLLPINSYGEGFNINPTITAAKGWKNWTFAAGLGYLWRGKYDVSESLTDYKPGMAINTVAEARYYYRPKSFARIFTGYTIYGTGTANGSDALKEGNVFQIGGSVSHVLRPAITVSGGLTGIIHGEANSYNGAGSRSYNGNEAVFDLGGSYALNSKTVLSVPFQTRLTASSDVAGAKEKVSLGVGVSREIIPKILSADGTFKGFYKHDAAGNVETNTYNYTGVALSASITGRF